MRPLCGNVPLALFQFNRQKIIKVSLFWVHKTNFLRTDVFQSTCFCTFKAHLPCCLLLELREFLGATLEAMSTSLKYSGNKEKMIRVYLSRSTYIQYIRDLSGVTDTGRGPSSPGHQSHVLNTD